MKYLLSLLIICIQVQEVTSQDLIISGDLQQAGILADITATELLVLKKDSTIGKAPISLLNDGVMNLRVSHFNDNLFLSDNFFIKVPGISRYNYTAQELLDLGESVSDMVRYGYDFSELYGLEYQDGIIAWLEAFGNNTKGLVFNKETDFEEVWGCVDLEITGPTSNSISLGPTNTASIISQCGPLTSAGITDSFVSDNYNDWHLPTQSALTKIYENVVDGNNPTDLPLGTYWSSVGVVGKSEAKSVSFVDGSILNDSRGKKNIVLPIRLFLE